MYTDKPGGYCQSSVESYVPSRASLHVEAITGAGTTPIVAGSRVKVSSGPLQGAIGIAASARSGDRWLVQVLEAGCYIEIGRIQLERIAHA
jgi:hypothetical protein